MKTTRDKYMNDPQFHELINVLESFVDRAQFTPSELREAAVLASINYEMRHIRDIEICPRIEDALRTLDKFVSKRQR